jgi:Ca-activated chloride channel family protein
MATMANNKCNGQAQRAAVAGNWRSQSPHWHPPAPPAGQGLAEILRRRIGTVAAIVLFFALLPPVYAQEELPPDAGLVLHSDAGYSAATKLNTDVEIDVSGIVARVTVKQVFRNDGSTWSEGLYQFPLPDDAAVDRMRLQAGERIIVGEIQEKAAAQKAYETAKREGKRASLVNQQRRNLFTTSVANIGPGETVTIEISYLQPVAYDDGAFSLRFPTTLTPRYIPGQPLADKQGSGWSPDTDQVPDASLVTPPMVTRSSDHRIRLRASIDAGMPLEVIASRYHPIDVNGADGSYTVTLRNSAEMMDHDFELVWRAALSKVPRVALFAEPQQDENHLLLLLLPPSQSAEQDAVPPRDLTLVIDTSGSMQGVSLEQAKQAVQLALDGLRDQDHFNLIQFNSVTDMLYPQSVPVTSETLRTARAWVQGLVANGGTEMRPALAMALRGSTSKGLRQVVFVTDGSVGNETELFSFIEQKLGDTRLFTVGIGSAPNGFFMRKAAETGRGTFVTISALHEVQEKMTRLMSRLRDPVITDIQLEWPDGLGVTAYPERVADLYRGEPVLVSARLQTLPRDGDLLLVTGDSPAGAWSMQVPLAKPGSNAGIAALWARADIATLLDRARQQGNVEAEREAVLATALRYHLVSPYTSLVAVDRTPVRPTDEALSRDKVPNLLPYGQSHRAIFGFPATATFGPLQRMLGAACLLLATLLLFLRVWNVRSPGRALADEA